MCKENEVQKWKGEIQEAKCIVYFLFFENKTNEISKNNNFNPKFQCILRCAMIKAELTTEDGQVTAASVDYLLQKYVPPSLTDHANKTFYPCMDIGSKK